MNLKTRIKLRFFGLLTAIFIVVCFVFGFTYASATVILATLIWKAYGWYKLGQYWESQSDLDRKMFEYVCQQLKEGRTSRNIWVQCLDSPEMRSSSRNYGANLIAQQKTVAVECEGLVEGWAHWGATRVEKNVMEQSEEVLQERVAVKAHPISIRQLMIERTAFETLVAEHALTLLGVDNSRAAISQVATKRALDRLII